MASEGGLRDSPSAPSEFRTLEEMTRQELAFEVLQRWSLCKSDTAWWIHRNEVPFMRVSSKSEGERILHRYNLTLADVDERQRPLTGEDFQAMRRDRFKKIDD